MGSYSPASRRFPRLHVLAFAACFALPFAAAAQTDTNATDQMLAEFGITNYATYRTNFSSLGTMGFQPDSAPTTNDSGPAWFDYWKGQLGGDSGSTLAGLRYYIRRNPTPVTDLNYTNFGNVQRVMRIMPKAKFEAMFPNSTNATPVPVTDLGGTAYTTGPASDPAASSVYWHSAGSATGSNHSAYFSYENFLKAVALMPGFCGDYADYPDPTLAPILQTNADLIARKFLASVFAHAVQETSSSGQGDTPTLDQKIPGTFGSVVEVNGGLYPDPDGIFRISTGGDLSAKGALYPLTLLPGGATYSNKPVSHAYCGRGIKQTSYPANYANASLFLFGDLRLLAYPELVEEPGVMAFLSGLVYAMLPKDSNPSIFEVMDGSFHRQLQQLAQDPSVAANPDYQQFVGTYDQEFPLTVLLVNGGPECNGNPANTNNTKIRIAAYNYFVTTTNLLSDVQVGGVEASTPPFTPFGQSGGDQYVPADGSPATNAFYNLTGNHQTCQSLMINTINVIGSPNPWQSLYVRPLYFGPNWAQVLAVQPVSGGNLPIFGGEAVHETMAKAFPSSDTDGDGLTDRAELATFGSSPLLASTFGDGLTDGQKHALLLNLGAAYSGGLDAVRSSSRADGVASVTGNPSQYGLYTPSSIHDLSLGGVILQAGTNGTAELRLQAQSTPDLGQSFTNHGPPVTLPVELPVNAGKYFLRVRASAP